MTSYPSTVEFYEKHRDKIGTLERKFSGYIIEISKKRIRDYLCQFELNHKPAALKMLEKINYYSNARVSTLSKKLGGQLKKTTNGTFENVYFCPINSSSGSSTGVMIHKLRNYRGLNASKHDTKFIYVADLQDFALDPQSEILNLQEKIAHIKNLPNGIISEHHKKIAGIESQITSLEKKSKNILKKNNCFCRRLCGIWSFIL